MTGLKYLTVWVLVTEAESIQCIANAPRFLGVMLPNALPKSIQEIREAMQQLLDAATKSAAMLILPS